jgi:hypothetical protein
VSSRWIPAVLCLLVLSGCREELGRDPFVTAPTKGRMHVGPNPVVGGWIEFLPIDGAVGTMRSAPIRPDGTFEVDAVAVGPNSVGVVGAPLDASYRRLFDTLGTPIRRVIPRNQPVVLDIDLEDEFIHWRARSVRIER